MELAYSLDRIPAASALSSRKPGKPAHRSAATPRLAPLPQPGTRAYVEAASNWREQKPWDLSPIGAEYSDEVFDMIHQLEDFDRGRERGFWVHGGLDGSALHLELPDALQTGEPATMLVDRDAAVDLAARRGCKLVAFIHAHPVGPALPSPADLDFVRANAESFGHLFGIGIVAKRELGAASWDSDPWYRPTFNLFVANPAGDVVKVEPHHRRQFVAA
jgi:hypothetical protein